MALTAVQADEIDKARPALQKVGLGTEVRRIATDNDSYGVFHLVASITSAAHSTAASITVPWACEVLDVIVQARATSGSGTATLRVSTNAITNAIAMDTDTNITRAGTIDDARSTLAAGDNLNVITAGSGDRGLVTVVVRKV